MSLPLVERWTSKARRRLLRVMFALPDKRARGGTPSHLYLLRDSLAAQGIDVHGFLYGGRTHDESLLRKVFGRSLDLSLFAGQLIWRRPDVVHLNSAFDRRALWRDVFFAPLARISGHKVVIKMHGSDLALLDRKDLPVRLLVELVVRSAHLVCVLNAGEKAAFAKRFPNTPIAVVKNALDLERYRSRRDFRAVYGIPRDKPLLLFVARFIPGKGLRDVIEALPLVRDRFDVHTVFVGDGPARREAEQLCRELGLADHTTFTGHLPEDETVDAYLSATMLVFPTALPEGLPMVVFHALACSLPVVTTQFRAAGDWLQHDKHCVFVPPCDPTSVADAIVRLLDEPAHLESLGKNGHGVSLQFAKQAVAREFLALYHSLFPHSEYG